MISCMTGITLKYHAKSAPKKVYICRKYFNILRVVAAYIQVYNRRARSAARAARVTNFTRVFK